MTFVAATGSNNDEANSFTDVAFADAYFSLRGNEIWGAATDNQKQAALIKATDYIEQEYSSRWLGQATDTGLSWPRYCVQFPSDVIPDNLKKATCELALVALTTDLNPAISRERAVISEKVDVIEVKYSETGTQPTIYPAVNGYLLPLLGGSSINRRVVRV